MPIARHHAEWLSLVEVSGPFLSLPVLEATFPQGLEYADQAEQVRRLRLAYEEWHENQSGPRPDPAIQREWVRFVLRELLEWPDALLAEGQTLPPDLKASMLEYHETLRPDLALLTPTGRPEAGQARLLVQVYPPEQDLEKDVAKERRWKASPATRMLELLHACGVRLGLVTNGERWMLVNAPRGESTGYVSWYAEVWLEERVTLQAFRSVLCARRFFGVPDGETLEALLNESAENQAEVTDRLGEQVRRAVEVLVQTVDRIDRERGRALLAGMSEQYLYNAALTVMMRLVFLFCAEERGLLLRGELLYDQHYAVSTLGAQLRQVGDQHGEEVLERHHDAWSRLLATFRAVHGGVEHEAMRLPAYGGHLFDPDRYPFLEGRAAGTHWRETPAQPLPVDNRTVLHLLEALQLLQMRTASGGALEKQRLSFRALDIEQIGHVYEGLLDHTARRAAGPVLGLEGRRENVTEVPLADLEAAASKGTIGLLALLAERTGRAQSAIKRRLEAQSTLEEAAKLRVACDNNEALSARVLPYAGLLRLNTFGYPVVIAPGSVYVTAGEDRRSSGTHYTPRSLTEPMVQHTLDPLVYLGPAEGKPREQWIRQDAAHILGLKVCDLAMGSGAFLVQAARYLSARLLEAWEAAEAGYRAEGRAEPQITPEGALSKGDHAELLVPRDADDRRTVALRLICERCLYGVDKNPMAVEMAKLSLWLTTLAKEKPFTFLDHALRCGDSLLGANVAQLENWSLEPGKHGEQLTWFGPVIRQARDVALSLRRQIASMPENEARDVEAKEHLLAEAEAAMALVKLGADLLIGSALAPTPKERERLRQNLLARYFTVATTQAEHNQGGFKPEAQAKADEERIKLHEEAERLLAGRRPFHWWLEFPEVFAAEAAPTDAEAFEAELARLRKEGQPAAPASGPAEPVLIGVQVHTLPFEPGFAALLGNPPFMGGQKITGALGDEYREYLVQVLAGGQRGSADLCAYFFLRAGDLLRQGGHMGLLATNTIAQGDTREVGLDQLAAQGFSIYRAVPSREWPGTASLEVAHVWLRHGRWAGPFILNEQPVTGITAFLTEPGPAVGKPYRLVANGDKSFMGSIVLGMGFVMTPEEAQALIDKDQHNKNVLFPYLNGDDLNSQPDQSASRWVINFQDWPLEQAEKYPDCIAIVREKVKPERDRLASGDATARDRARRWWQFGRPTVDLYNRIADMQRVLVCPIFTKHLSFCFVPTAQVFMNKLYIFPFDELHYFAFLSSNLHEVWARQYSATLETRLQYASTDSFETFPFPEDTASLEGIGQRYYLHRQEIMLRRQEGLTKTYNRFHDPNERAEDIAALRALHAEMDRAVALAYGWGDLDLGHGFHQTKQGTRYTISEAARQEALGRLLALNHQRYRQEEALGLHDKGKGKKRRAPNADAAHGSSPAEATVRLPGLFDEQR